MKSALAATAMLLTGCAAPIPGAWLVDTTEEDPWLIVTTIDPALGRVIVETSYPPGGELFDEYEGVLYDMAVNACSELGFLDADFLGSFVHRASDAWLYDCTYGYEDTGETNPHRYLYREGEKCSRVGRVMFCDRTGRLPFDGEGREL